MENKETKSYKEVYEKEGSYDKILKQYNYCESDNVSSTNTSSGNETYFNIIRSVLNNKEKKLPIQFNSDNLVQLNNPNNFN